MLAFFWGTEGHFWLRQGGGGGRGLGPVWGLENIEKAHSGICCCGSKKCKIIENTASFSRFGFVVPLRGARALHRRGHFQACWGTKRPKTGEMERTKSELGLPLFLVRARLRLRDGPCRVGVGQA